MYDEELDLRRWYCRRIDDELDILESKYWHQEYDMYNDERFWAILAKEMDKDLRAMLKELVAGIG